MIKIKQKQTKKLKKRAELEPIALQASRLCDVGFLFQKKGDLDKAIPYYQKALELHPEHAVALYNLASAYHHKGQSERAIPYYQRSLELEQNALAYNNLGAILQQKGNLTEAITCYKKALKMNPDYNNAYTNLGSALLETGQLDEAALCYTRVIQSRPDHTVAFQSLLNTMLYSPHYTAQSVFSEHLSFAKQFAEPLSGTIAAHRNDRTINRRLRIGYVSPDFRHHSVAYFIEPVLHAHNREHNEIYCYSDTLVPDSVTKRIQDHADQWRPIAAMSDEQAAELIRKDAIDILVDLSGHTAHNRILVFARKPAPVQASWIGYPATTGLSAVDYKIVDDRTDPPGLTEEFYTERLIRLPGGFLCYQPPMESPDVHEAPFLRTGHISFGSFNAMPKMTPEVLALWATILKAVPNSRLVLKAKSLLDTGTRERVLRTCADAGIEPERIVLHARVPSIKEHLNLYGNIDIALDTFPYTGATTTCEALWMGVPVVTLAGATHVARVGASLLANLGLPEFIAGTPDKYLSIAVDLAVDRSRLQALRQLLRDTMRHSPLCNAKRFTANLELSYRRMWEEWCRSTLDPRKGKKTSHHPGLQP